MAGKAYRVPAYVQCLGLLVSKEMQGAGCRLLLYFEAAGAGRTLGRLRVKFGSVSVEADGHGVEREGAEEVAAHALLDLDESAGGRVDPVHIQVLGEAVEFRGEVDVADKLRRAGEDQKQVFEEAPRGAEEVDGFFLAVGAGAVAFCGME